MEIRPRVPADLEDLIALATLVHKNDGYPIHLPNDDTIARQLVTGQPGITRSPAVIFGNCRGEVATR